MLANVLDGQNDIGLSKAVKGRFEFTLALNITA